MFFMQHRLLLLLFLIGCLASCSPDMPSEVAEAYATLPDKIDFNFHVRSILSDNCYACHGPDENARKANLRLDTKEAAFAKLETGNYAFVPGKPFDSEAIRRILTDDPNLIMPTPESKIKLSAEQKAILIKWLEQGAEWKAHWSFIPPEKTTLPEVSQTELVQNPIDNFVLAKLERQRLSLSPKADKATLIRRITLDLTGLPPKLEEVDAFLQDDSPEAFEKVVNRLLASPQFGERWAWDWLDAARYADTNGFQGDPERKMWPWRDWVVQAFNDNMPYDQFTVEQLAGDLLPNASREQILATAFNRNHMYNGEGGRIPEETRVENVFDRVETTGTVWLGLTLNCSRCHDHKFDAITQKEYYQFYDYFNQTSEAGLNGGGMIPPVLDMSPPLEQAKVEELQAFVEKVGKKVEAFEKEIFPSPTDSPADSPAAADLDGDNLFTLSFPPSERNSYYVGQLSNTFLEKNAEYAQLLQKLRTAINKKNGQAAKNLQVMVMDEIPRHRQTFVLDRGTYNKPKEAVNMNVPAVLPPLENRTHNRLELAQWLVMPDHPLTARVTVNRFWQSLFGTGLVKTPDDFGVQGAIPTHPELLDWLAVDFVESGWDVKALLKKMVLSATYQQSSKTTPELVAVDPENKLWSRAARHRLHAWMLRDQALAVSGLLQDSIGGPPVKPYQPDGLWAEATFGKKKYVQDTGAALYRRTLYTFWRRIIGPPMLFDNSPRQVCSVKPVLTNSPQHALITLNDITYVEAARVMAERVLTERSSESKQISYAFRLATARWPKPEEKQILQKRLQEFQAAFEQNTSEATALLQTGEYRQNEALDPVQQAAFTTLCSVILNLDETLNRQ